MHALAGATLAQVSSQTCSKSVFHLQPNPLHCSHCPMANGSSHSDGCSGSGEPCRFYWPFDHDDHGQEESLAARSPCAHKQHGEHVACLRLIHTLTHVPGKARKGTTRSQPWLWLANWTHRLARGWQTLPPCMLVEPETLRVLQQIRTNDQQPFTQSPECQCNKCVLACVHAAC